MKFHTWSPSYTCQLLLEVISLLENEISPNFHEILNFHTQINLSRNNLQNYRKLLDAEETRYGIGESSLFLINSRENKVIDAQEKFISIRTKFLKSFNKLKWLKENFLVATTN